MSAGRWPERHGDPLRAAAAARSSAEPCRPLTTSGAVVHLRAPVKLAALTSDLRQRERVLRLRPRARPADDAGPEPESDLPLGDGARMQGRAAADRCYGCGGARRRLDAFRDRLRSVAHRRPPRADQARPVHLNPAGRKKVRRMPSITETASARVGSQVVSQDVELTRSMTQRGSR